jgi:disulfide bond formation protein DsbB
MAAGDNSATRSSAKFVLVALLLSLIAVFGSLALTRFLGLRACPLCFYQRAFALSVAGVLGMGLLLGFGGTGRLGLLALPLATGGLGVALFHVWLELNGTLVCPAGLLSIGSAPQQSLAIFALIFLVLLADVLSGGPSFGKGFQLCVMLALGAAITIASLIANPRMVSSTERPPDMCYPV